MLPSLVDGPKYSIGDSRAFSAIYDWNGRALSKDLVRFEGFVDFVVRFLYGFRAFGVEGKEEIRRLFGNDTTVVPLGLAQNPDIRIIECTNPLITSCRASSSPACTSVTSTFFLHAFLPLREGCLCCRGASVDGPMIRRNDVRMRAGSYRNSIKNVEGTSVADKLAPFRADKMFGRVS